MRLINNFPIISFTNNYDFEVKIIKLTSIGAKSSFSRPAVVKVVDKLELFNHSLH